MGSCPRWPQESGRAAGRFSSPCIQFKARQAPVDISASNLRRCPLFKPPEDHAGRSRNCGKRENSLAPLPRGALFPAGARRAPRLPPQETSWRRAGSSASPAFLPISFHHRSPRPAATPGRLPTKTTAAAQLPSQGWRHLRVPLISHVEFSRLHLLPIDTTRIRSYLWVHQVERRAAAGEVFCTGPSWCGRLRARQALCVLLQIDGCSAPCNARRTHTCQADRSSQPGRRCPSRYAFRSKPRSFRSTRQLLRPTRQNISSGHHRFGAFCDRRAAR